MKLKGLLYLFISAFPSNASNSFALFAWFGIPAADLNLAQATLLAAIPNDPTDLNPYSNWQGLKQRQAYAIDRLVADEYITRTEGDRALAEKISLQPRDRGIIAAPHFLFFVAQHLGQQHPAVVKTTIDRPLQQFVEAQLAASSDLRHDLEALRQTVSRPTTPIR